MAEEEEDGLKRQGSDELADYPDGLPGTTPPNDNRLEKTMKARNKKSGKKSPSNETKRFSRGNAHSPNRELESIDESIFSNPKAEFKYASSNESLPSRTSSGTLTQSYSVSEIEDANKRHSIAEGGEEDNKGNVFLHRRNTDTMTSSSKPSKLSKGKRKQSSKSRKSESDMKRSSLEGSEDTSTEAGKLFDDYLSRNEETRSRHNSSEVERSRALSKSESIGDTKRYASDDEPPTIKKKNVRFDRRSTIADPQLMFQDMSIKESRRAKMSHNAQKDGSGSSKCPKERREFYNHLNFAIVRLGIMASVINRPVGSLKSSQQQHRYNRMYSEGNVRGRQQREDLWVQLNMYLHGISPEEQPGYQETLLQRRWDVKSVISEVLHFRLPLTVGLSFKTSDYDEIPGSSLDLQYARGLPLLQSMSEPSSTVEVQVDGVSTNSSLETLKDTQPLVQFHEEGSAPKSLNLSQPKEFVRQPSIKPSFTPESFLNDQQHLAMKQVAQLLDRVDEVENLYPSMSMIANDSPEYNYHTFTCKLEALQLWYKITDTLAERLAVLSKWFQIPVKHPSEDDITLVERTSSTESGTPSHSASSTYLPCLSPSQPPTSPGGEEKKKLDSSLTSAPSPSLSNKSFSRVSRVGRYHRFVAQGLKKGIGRMMSSLSTFINPTLQLALSTLSVSEAESRLFGDRQERTPIHPRRTSVIDVDEPDAPVDWLAEFDHMNLPMFYEQFILLARVRLDIMHECLRLQLYLKPPKSPSEFSISRLVAECRETLQLALDVRKEFEELMFRVSQDDVLRGAHFDNLIEGFELDLADVFDMYLDYLEDWMKKGDRGLLMVEWSSVKELSMKMKGREAKAAKRFCIMAATAIRTSWQGIQTEVDESMGKLFTVANEDSCSRKCLSISREFKSLFTMAKEKSSKILGNARALIKDLEVAIDLHLEVSQEDLMGCLHATDHVQVEIAGRMDRGKRMFVPKALVNISKDKHEISELLTLAFGRELTSEEKQQYARIRDQMYILIMGMDPSQPMPDWPGRPIHIDAGIEAAISAMELEVKGIKLVAWNNQCLESCYKTVQKALGMRVIIERFGTSSHHDVAQCLEEIKEKAIDLCVCVLRLYQLIRDQWDLVVNSEIEETKYRDMVLTCFGLGFECTRETIRLLGDDVAYMKLGRCIHQYTLGWIDFICKKCPKGRGSRPRWAVSGLDFLMTACNPRILAQLDTEEYDNLKRRVDDCLIHVMGSHFPPDRSRAKDPLSTGMNGSKRGGMAKRYGALGPEALSMSLPTRTARTPRIEQLQWTTSDVAHKFQSVNQDPEYETSFPPLSNPPKKTPPSSNSSSSSGVVKDSPPVSAFDEANLVVNFGPIPFPQVDSEPSVEAAAVTDCGAPVEEDHYIPRSEKIKKAAKEIEEKRQKYLFSKRMIGQITSKHHKKDEILLSTLKQIDFTWMRGIRLGKGASGVVYQAFNAKTGETMAVKHILIQESNQDMIKRLVEEIANLQRLRHRNIIQYYGVEVHRCELFLFMEYCPEGTVWDLAQQGLSEAIIRRYTNEILQGINEIHERGIVHRDIKGANIFISYDGHLKLGDFGLSFQLESVTHTKMNEISDHVGTVAYMAPEVIHRGTKGYSIGRGSDLWSLGCTVLEMVTGKSPWYGFNEYQIMFKVGTENAPKIPDTISDEGRDFLDVCFKYNPKERKSASELLLHPFVKVELYLEVTSL